MSLDDEQIEKLLKWLLDSGVDDKASDFLASLTPEQAIALREKYGGDLFDSSHTLEEVQAKLDATRERIRRLEENALRKLGKSPPAREGHMCGFCGKYESEVKKVITWDTGATICNECIQLAKEIIDDEE